jgi:hypothetical protein
MAAKNEYLMTAIVHLKSRLIRLLTDWAVVFFCHGQGTKKAPLISGAFINFCRKQDEILLVDLHYEYKILQALELLRAARTS